MLDARMTFAPRRVTAVLVFYFRFEERIMVGDAGSAIREVVLGYLVVYRGLVPRVAGVAITGLTIAAESSSIFRSIQEVGT